MTGNFDINKELLDAMRIIARQEIEKCNRDITKTARVIAVNTDKTVKIEMDGKQYDNIPNYNGTTLTTNDIVKVTYPQGQPSNMYVSGGGDLDEIYSNLANKNIIGTYNIPNITGVSTAPENITSGYHNVAKYSNGQCIYSALVYVYTSAIANSVIGTISSQYAPKQDVSAYVYDFAGNRFLMVLISSDGTIKLLTLEGTAIPESAVKLRGSVVF